jgi:uncharacterized membrane protein YfcA
MSSLTHFLDIVQNTLAGYPVKTLALLFGSVLLAGVARGFSGFGAALIFVPLASAFVGPKMASPILLVIDTVCAAGLLPAATAKADKKDVGAMSLGAVIGVPAGVALLVHVDPIVVRWVISMTALGFLGLLMSGRRYRGKPYPPLAAGVGMVAGVYSGTAQLGGPPVVAYWLGGANTIPIVRANLVLYFAISSIFTAVSYYYAGLLITDVFLLAAICGPLYAIGLFVGARSFGLASEQTFRGICYVLIGVAAVSSLPLLDGYLR